MQKKVVTFGEVMMRLSPLGQARFTQASRFDVLYAGSEANVAASLSSFGIPSAHITCFPGHDLGKAAVAQLRQYGVDMDHTVYKDGRIGIYFIEHGASIRSPKIIYDRFESSFANLDPADFDWSRILKDTQWFHWSGITPAISQSAANACLDAITMARKAGVMISGDINYRRNLWQYGKRATDIMPALIELSDVVIAGVTDFENCLEISDRTFETTCEKVAKAYPNIQKVASTVRETVSASHNRISGILWSKKQLHHAQTYDLNPIVDRVGAGDAFMAGLIYGLQQKRDDQQALEFATAACALKHTIEGDVNTASVEEVETLVKGENIGKLLR
jgi:2-dehydro-3-deoxygluconokinase